MEIYRAMLSDDRNMVIATHKQLQMTMEIMLHGPWGREIFREDEESFIWTRYIPEMIDRIVIEYLQSPRTRRRLIKPSESASEDGQT